MLAFEPNIIIVDDKKDEVKGIIEYYNDLGVGCKYYNADFYDGDAMPDIPYSDINLIFLDLYYSEEDFDAELCSNWVQSLVPEKSFYVLIIWTKDPAKADEVIEELKKVNRLPFKFLVKNKIDFQDSGELMYDYSKLFDDINEDLENTPSLSEMGIWKKSLKRASNVVIGSLAKDIDPNIFRSKLQKIIIGHGGNSVKDESNNEKKRGILFEALDQVLVSNTKHSIPTDIISKVNEEELYSLTTPESACIDKELNSWFHFKLEKELSKDLIQPGLICENTHAFFKKFYSIQDDEKISIRLLNQQENAVITDIVLVLTRSCDIAQSKFGKNIKLLSGLIINNPNRTKKGKVDFNGTTPDSMKIYDHLFLNNTAYNDATIVFDFRYIFSVPEKIFIDRFKNIKIFNKELLSEMQVEYSSYSSRLGITQII